jgi:hypothetical protein
VNLEDVAAVIDRLTSIDPDDEARARAWLSNLLIGIERGHIAPERAERRIAKVVQSFFSARPQDHSALLDAQIEAMLLFGEQDHYLRPGPLSAHRDVQALTVQANEDGLLGQPWLGKRTRGAEIATAFADGLCSGQVGAPDRPLWVTPYRGALKALCEEAKRHELLPERRSMLAKTLVSTLGLVHVHPGDEVLAFVSKNTIGELAFSHPDFGGRCEPVGPTAIEARGHRRFRPWPAPLSPETYGRTYALDGAARAGAKPKPAHGVEEAVRPALPIEEFEQCIYIGVLTDAGFDDSDAEFLATIGARQSCPALMRRLAKWVAR